MVELNEMTPLRNGQLQCKCGTVLNYGPDTLVHKCQPDKATTVQVGGDHYSKMAIQPVEYIHLNSLGFCEGSVVKYVSRWRSKNGIEDLRKARHFIDMLIDLETMQ